MAKQQLSYTEAVTELEAILANLESNVEVNMEEISTKVKRAAELMEFCKKQLHQLDTDLEKVLDSLNE